MINGVNLGLSEIRELHLNVLPGAAPLLVEAGPQQTICLPAQAQLGGMVDGKVVVSSDYTMTWTVLSGPSTAVTFSSPNCSTTWASFPQAGNYTLQLNASKGSTVGSDKVFVEVEDCSNVDVDAGPSP